MLVVDLRRVALAAMASSDSTRKVARVASRSAPSGPKQNKNWLFPVAIVAIVAIGVSIVFIARSRNEGYGGNDTPPRAQLAADSTAFDHWHAAFAVNICGTELPPNSDASADILGIHTHQDGLIHIHPFSVQAAGKRATLQRYFDQVGMDVSDDKVVLPVEYNGSRVYESGVTTCGGEPARWVLGAWDTATGAVDGEPDEIVESDFGGVRFTEDLQAFTLAFLPEGSTDIPGPSSAAQIDVLGECDGENPPPECEQLLAEAQAQAATTVPEPSTATTEASTETTAEP